MYCSDMRIGDDITLDISQSSGTASPPQETRTKRKKTQTSKGANDVSVDEVITDTPGDMKPACDDQSQTKNDIETLVIWR